jgi:RNA polymerase sigma-70 factor (ECF subfamily)
MTPFAELVRRYLADEPYRQLPDDDLWARFRDHRDETAFRVFLDRCGARIYLRCRALLGEDALAEDAFQETFAELVRHATKLPGYRAAVAWLYQTATYKSLQMVRAGRRARRREEQAAAPMAVPARAEAELAAWERQRALATALVRLPTTQRRLVELVYLEGMTHAEAADVLGIARSAVGTHVHRGLGRLRQHLGGAAGLAVLGATTVESALFAHSLPFDRGLAYRLADAAWVRAAQPLAAAAPGWLGWKPLAVGVAGLGLTVGGVSLATRSDEANEPAPVLATAGDVVRTAAGEPETLQARNLRILQADVVPQLVAQYRQSMPADNPLAAVEVRTFGSEVEVEMRPTRLIPNVFPMRLQMRYCMLRRQLLAAEANSLTGPLRELNLPRPIPTGIPNPLAPFAPLVQTTPGADDVRWAGVRRAFARLPADERAEADHLRHLFGPSGEELVLPVGCHVAGFPGGLITQASGHGLYVRDLTGRWRYAGICAGWGATVADGRVYCTGDAMIRSRPLDDPLAPWERVCEAPPTQKGQEGMYYFVVDRTHVVACAGNVAWVRPMGPAATWTRVESPTWLNGATAAGNRIYGAVGDRLYACEFVPPGFQWREIGPSATNCTALFVDGSRIVAYDQRQPGPLYARPLDAGPDDPWREIGRFHDPYAP